MQIVESLCSRINDIVHTAVENIQQSAVGGIALVVDAERRLIGTVTDGDPRRAILNGIFMDDGIERLQENRIDVHREPTVAPGRDGGRGTPDDHEGEEPTP